MIGLSTHAGTLRSLLASAIALPLALLVWTWLRLVAPFYLSDNWDILGGLLKSVTPLKSSVEGAVLLLLPTLGISHVLRKRFESAAFVLACGAIGIALSVSYLLWIANLNLTFILSHLWNYAAAGALSGVVYGGIVQAPWASGRQTDERGGEFATRRNVLGLLAGLSGAAGLLGGLAGPWYFWRNRETRVEVDLAGLGEGGRLTVEIANQPVWIIRRTPEIIAMLKQPNAKLLDPESRSSRQPEEARNNFRSIRPEYFVVNAVCTHLGCSPMYLPEGWSDQSVSSHPEPQFFCPCHGGVFDLAGRVYKGTPPPTNLTVPEHTYLSDGTLQFRFPTLKQKWSGGPRGAS